MSYKGKGEGLSKVMKMGKMCVSAYTQVCEYFVKS